MVAKRVAGVAGSAAGGFFNNPGVVAILGIAITVITSLLIFRKDIGSFFSNLGSVEFPEINLPDINFPTFEFPTFEFPSLPDITFPTFEFPDINIDFPSFDFGNIFEPSVDEERMDVPFGDDGQEIDIVPDVTGGRADRLDDVITEDEIPDVVVTETETETGTLFEVSIGGNEPIDVSGDPDVSGFDFSPFTTLSDIIDEFGVSASQAADILGEGLMNFGDFLFGTNTGSGGQGA